MKNQIIKTSKNMRLDKTISNLQEVIQKTILSAQKYKLLDIFGANELNICITTLENIFSKLQGVYDNSANTNILATQYVQELIDIKDELTIIFKNFGTESFKELLSLLLGEEYIDEYFNNDKINSYLSNKFDIIKDCIHPINFKILPWKGTNISTKSANIGTSSANTKVNRLIDDNMIIEHAENLDCFDLARSSLAFQIKVYGIKVVIHDYNNKKTYLSKPYILAT